MKNSTPKTQSTSTPLGNRLHAIRTANPTQANEIYERALDAGHEPEINRRGRSLVIEFYATDADAQAVVA